MSSPQTLKVEIAQLSDPGRDPNKQINEDSCGYAKTRYGHLCVLCDGMGGHYGGQEASRRAITTIFEQIDRADASATPAMALKAAIEEAARRVYELGGPPDNRARPGSTVVAILMHDAGVDVAHVGDSRAYVVRSDQIYPLTRDHSMVQSMIDAGMLTEEQAIGHPDANKITRALGMKPDVEVDVRPDSMELFPGDLLVLTSDGLTDLALSNDILQKLRETLRVGTLNDACTELVKLANDRGGHDNITVQLARVVRTAPKPTRTGHTTTGETGVSPTLGGNSVGGNSVGGNSVGGTALGGASLGGSPIGGHEPERRAGHTIPIPGTSHRPVDTRPDGPGPTITEAQHHAGHAAPPGVGPTVIQSPDLASPAPPSIRFGGAANQPFPSEREPIGPMSTRFVPSASPSGSGLGGYPAVQSAPLQAHAHVPPQTLPRAPAALTRTEPIHAAFPTPVDRSVPPSTSPYAIPESVQQGRGSVLFLWLGASFFVATLALFVVWALFLR